MMKTDSADKKMGAWPTERGVRFRVWAPYARNLSLLLRDREYPMSSDNRGTFEFEAEGAQVGDTYRFSVEKENGDKLVRPDPASRYQPEGVHGPSQVISPDYAWSDKSWRGLDFKDALIYELHIGTFTREGTFDSAIEKIPYLRELGITVVEIMPVAQFPGERNWGYDGVYPFAVQNSYGGPQGLKKFTDACHRAGLGVILDVVYNHLGPEGNYLQDFGPYFYDQHRTPWGSAINFDGPMSDQVREYFVQNAIQWCEEFHLDGLRLDAVHAIFDQSALHFLKELNQRVQPAHLIAESDLNARRFIDQPERGGFGLSGMWSDDFHHALHALLTGERSGYYRDFGSAAQLVSAMNKGVILTGQYSEFRKKNHGEEVSDLPPQQFVICSQNHDQVGNRMCGERLTQLVSPEKVRLAAAATILSPYSPLLFMGEEYGEENPFLYFVSHGDADLVEAVRQGRKREFSEFFHNESDPPDPQSVETFFNSKLDWERLGSEEHQKRFREYQELIRIRKRLIKEGCMKRGHFQAELCTPEGLICLSYGRQLGAPDYRIFLNFSEKEAQVDEERLEAWDYRFQGGN